MIGRVHGDGDLPVIPVKQNATRYRHGAYSFWRSGGAREITISKLGDHQELTLAHEIGHFLGLNHTLPKCNLMHNDSNLITPAQCATARKAAEAL